MPKCKPKFLSDDKIVAALYGAEHALNELLAKVDNHVTHMPERHNEGVGVLGRQYAEAEKALASIEKIIAAWESAGA